MAFLRARRASSMIGLALMIGLIAVVAIVAIGATGSSIQRLFLRAGNVLALGGNSIATGVGNTGGGTTPAPDTTPDAFTVTFSSTPAPGTAVTSNAFQITGISTPVAASVTGDDTPILQLSANGTSGWAPLGSGLVAENQYLRVSFTVSAGASGVARTGSVTVGSGAATPYAVASSTYTTCAAARAAGVTSDGELTIDPDGAGANAPFAAYCLMSEASGGWTLMAQMIPSTSSGLNLFSASAVGTLQLDSTSTGAPAKLSDATINSIRSTNEILILYDHLGWNTTTRSYSGWDAICRFDMANSVAWSSTSKMLSSAANMDSNVITCSRVYGGDGTYAGIGGSGTISQYSVAAELDRAVSLITTNTIHLIFSAPTTYSGGACGTRSAGRTWVGDSTYGCNAAKWFIR